MADTIIVDGKSVPIEGEKNLLELVRKTGVELPTLCYVPELSVYGGCRMCLVEDSRGMLVPSCSVVPQAGMEIKTNTPRVQRSRKMMLELLLTDHDRDCTVCPRNGNCKLQDLCKRYGVNKVRFEGDGKRLPIDESNPSLVRDPNKCILCGDCVRMCSEVQGIGAIDITFRGSNAQVLPAYGKGLGDVGCVNCGQCAAVCPTGALTIRSESDGVWNALRNPEKRVILQLAPAVRVAIGEEFGFAPGEITTGKIVAAVRRLGFDQIYDTSFAADLTTMEETDEFITRLLNEDRIPQFTSCCPAWVKAVEQYYPERMEQLSSCRSPQQMFGSLIKKYYARDEKLSPEDLFVVSVMPCTAKKFEAGRPEFTTEGIRDVDAVLTTQELASMIREAGIDFAGLEGEDFDNPFGFATGGGVIFGASGGVATAVVRQAALQIGGQRVTDLDYQPVEGQPGVYSAEVKVADRPIRIAIVSGLGNARRLVDVIDKGEMAFDILEVMACPGGCAGGGGQPFPNETPQRQARAKGLKRADVQKQTRVAQDNPIIVEVYRRWLEKPNSHLSHEALHTRYSSRRRIVGEEIEVIPQPDETTKEPVEVSVCVGRNCYQRGAGELLHKLTGEVQARQLGKKVCLRAPFCFEQCCKGPTVQVDGKEICGVKPEDVDRLLDEAVAAAEAKE
ncbi:MAG: [FeFe] hydrogenase, group A [Chloroflexota bacterium]|jgi:NADH-quinone oxidoreductase subunit G